MIIGDGIMLGAGGETASIIVTAPTGSTVTCTTPGGVVLTATEVSGTWAFARLKVYGTYTVTATNGTKTATQDVLVDSATQYDIGLKYKLWLYKDGDEYEDATGGWSQCTLKHNNRTFSTEYSSFTKMTDTGVFKFTLNKNNVYGFNGVAVGCANQIDVSNYTELGIKYRYFNLTSNSTSSINGSVYLGTVLGDYYYGQANISKYPSAGEVLENIDVTVDISNLSGKKYLWIQHENCAGNTVTVQSEMQVSEVWLA